MNPFDQWIYTTFYLTEDYKQYCNCCPPKKDMHRSYLSFSGEPEQNSTALFSSELYIRFPNAKPVGKKKRKRCNGLDVYTIPSEDRCRKAFEHYVCTHKNMKLP